MSSKFGTYINQPYDTSLLNTNVTSLKYYFNNLVPFFPNFLTFLLKVINKNYNDTKSRKLSWRKNQGNTRKPNESNSTT